MTDSDIPTLACGKRYILMVDDGRCRYPYDAFFDRSDAERIADEWWEKMGGAGMYGIYSMGSVSFGGDLVGFRDAIAPQRGWAECLLFSWADGEDHGQ